jgi:cytochrome bd-type quinol oxidase subunit 2
MSEPKPMRESAVGLVLGLIGGVAGITFFLYLVGVAVEFRRLKTLHLPTDQVVSALPRDLVLIIGVRSLVVPTLLAAGAAILVALLTAEPRGTQPSRGANEIARRVAVGVLGCALAAAAVAFIVVPRHNHDLFVEHLVLVGLVLLIGAGGWLMQMRLRQTSHAARLGFVATSVAAAVVVYVHAMKPPIHFDAATVVEQKGVIRGFYLGQSADDVFLAASPDGEHTCRILTVIATKQIESLSLKRSEARPGNYSERVCTNVAQPH